MITYIEAFILGLSRNILKHLQIPNNFLTPTYEVGVIAFNRVLWGLGSKSGIHLNEKAFKKIGVYEGSCLIIYTGSMPPLRVC